MRKIVFLTPLIALFASAEAAAGGLSVRRYFEQVPAFGITHACVVEADPREFSFRTLGAVKSTGRQKATALEVRRRLPDAALIINAGFFSLKDGAPIGEYVEGGRRPERVIYSPGRYLDRIFTVWDGGGVEVIAGREKLSEEELARAVSAVTGKSAWPEHSSATNRTAVCLTRGGKVLLAAVYPVRTVDDTLRYMESEGCIPEGTAVLDGGGSTQMSFWSGGRHWNLGWERRSASVPECHLRGDNRDARCYRPVGNFIVIEKKKGKND